MNKSKSTKKSVLFPFFLFSGAICMACFQNCSNGVAFGTAEKASSAQTAATGNITSIDKSCLDSDGTIHQSGDTWHTMSHSMAQVNCRDSAASQQGYNQVASMACKNGSITSSALTSSLALPMAACVPPNVSASLVDPNPQSGSSTGLLVSSQSIHDISYKCVSVANGSIVQSGNLVVGDSSTPIPKVTEDLTCQVLAHSTGMSDITANLGINVDCESSGKLKDSVTHQCVEFRCSQYMALQPTPNGTYDVPARTTAGICYSVKLMDAIANGSSSLTKATDQEIISRDHDLGGGYAVQKHPYLLGSSLFDFIMRKGGGARQVKLSGAGSTEDSIKVDNFIVVGLAKKAATLNSVEDYRAYGTLDSTIDAANTYISFKNSHLPLASFGNAGTSTINALDITTEVSTEEIYSLDVRALDCGGSRELSEIYLVFK
jgi:hypothetical protein